MIYLPAKAESFNRRLGDASLHEGVPVFFVRVANRLNGQAYEWWATEAEWKRFRDSRIHEAVRTVRWLKTGKKGH